MTPDFGVKAARVADLSRTRAHDPPARARVLAEPGGDLLLRRATQAAHPDDFANLDDLTEKITAFEKRYNHAARPVDWRFDRADLNQLIHRIAA